VAFQVQNIAPDQINKRGNINLYDQTLQASVNVSFPLNLTGSETFDQANAMIKARAKELLQAAIPIL
jgi:hypothetical protein